MTNSARLIWVAVVFFAVAAAIELGTSVGLLLGKVGSNPHAVAGVLSGVAFGGIGLISLILSLRK